jgi:ABC-type multidrug transport system ATPase subunit
MSSHRAKPIELRQVGKRYGRGPFVLGQVDATLAAGDVVHVNGGNGSGKSTLLRIIAGVSSPTRGDVSGRPHSVGFVPERFPPAIRFTPHAYLHHLAGVRGSSPSVALELLARLGGAGYADTPMVELSKGSCQKVALAQALAAPPGLLVLDEAWTGLDTDAQAVLTFEVQRQADDGATVVLTDHTRRTAAVHPSAQWYLEDGRLTESLATTPRARAVVVLLGEGADLAGLAGVVAAQRTPGRLSLEVTSTACDAILAEALRSGWSVHEVRPPR